MERNKAIIVLCFLLLPLVLAVNVHAESNEDYDSYSRITVDKNNDDADKVEQLLQQHHIEFAKQARQEYQMETGYDPNAPLPVKTRFTLKHMVKRKSALLLLAMGIFLLYLYFVLFFSLFH